MKRTLPHVHERFNNLPIRFKLFIGYSLIFTMVMLCGSLGMYLLVRQTITANIESELKNTNATIVNMVQTTAAASSKNYLRAITEKNRDIVSQLHQQVEGGEMPLAQAQQFANEILLSQQIGDTGYLYAADSTGTLTVHPQLQGADLSEHGFIQEQIRRKEGYLEYEWQNPDDPAPRSKALYMTYFAPWDWIIAASAYREEFQTLVNKNDFREEVLALQFGETGYPYVITSQGLLILHPKLEEGVNHFETVDANGRKFFQEICRQKQGKIVYDWQNPGETVSRKKLALFDYIPEFDWIVVSSSYHEEFYRPLQTIGKIVLGTLLISIFLLLVLTVWISTTITRPLQTLKQRFAASAAGDLTVRMTMTAQDEVGRLATYFNTFIGELEQTHEALLAEITQRKHAETELCQYRDHLEDLVTQRTAALEQEIVERKRIETALHQAKNEAESANKAKSLFLTNMSHELRTPLTAILGFAQLMARNQEIPIEEQENLTTIRHSGEHLLMLINSVLELSKIESGRMTLDETHFDLHRLLHDVEDMFRLKVEEKRLYLQCDHLGEIPRYVRTDEMKLRQVLINLLNNALKFTKEGGVIVRILVPGPAKGQVRRCEISDVEASHPPSKNQISNIKHLKFEIQDTGPGIAPDELKSVFEAFTQTSTGRDAQEGTGLGLRISWKFVQLMGGDMHVRSDVGQGTMFIFDIPVEVVDAFEAHAPTRRSRILALEPGQRAADGSDRYRILLVDDERTNRQLLLKLLNPFGFELREASNGQEAVEIWEEWEPHLIWMDMRMPVMDGYETTRRIREAERQTSNVERTDSQFHTKIISLTASSLEEERAVILSAGCDDFLRKPFREEDILEMMGKQIGVRYVYEEPPIAPDQDGLQAADGEQKADRLNVLTLEAFDALPSDLFIRLRQAVKTIDLEMTYTAIDEIRRYDMPLAETLTALVKQFRFDTLREVLKEEAG